MEPKSKSKNKKALLQELQGKSGDKKETKRSRGPELLGSGLVSTDEKGDKEETTQTKIDFIYRVDHEKYTVSFHNQSEGEDLDLVWDFGNGETFEGENPDKIDYQVPGKYKAILTDRTSGLSKEKSFGVKGDESGELSNAIKADKIKSVYTGGLESFLELSRKEEFDYGVINCRLDKRIHKILSNLSLGKGSIANLNNYIVLKFIEENREEIKKFINSNSQLDL